MDNFSFLHFFLKQVLCATVLRVYTINADERAHIVSHTYGVLAQRRELIFADTAFRTGPITRKILKCHARNGRIIDIPANIANILFHAIPFRLGFGNMRALSTFRSRFLSRGATPLNKPFFSQLFIRLNVFFTRLSHHIVRQHRRWRLMVEVHAVQPIAHELLVQAGRI